MSTVTTIGDKVKLKKDLIGTVRFIGEIEGKKGTYYGVELTEDKGKNKGSVGKISYFKCKSKFGVFVKKTSILKTNSKNNPKMPRISIGDKVTYIKGKSDGTIRYIGTPYPSKKSGTYYGVELQRPKGSNNGTVKGTKYFKCKAKHGVFLQKGEFIYHEHKLTKTIPHKPTKPSSRSKKKKETVEEPNKPSCKSSSKPSNEASTENTVNIPIQVDEHKETVSDQGMNVFDEMQRAMEQVKALMVAKDTEIANQKKMNDELKQQNKKEMDLMQSLLDKEKKINALLMDKLRSLETMAMKRDVNDIEEEKQMDGEMDHEENASVGSENDNDNIELEKDANNTSEMDQKQGIDETKERMYLVSGYVRNQHRLLDNKMIVSSRIVDICAMFYFEGVLKNLESKYLEIGEGGTRVRSSGLGVVNICCVSGKGFNAGVHSCTVECIACPKKRGDHFCGVGHAIGVASEFEEECDFDNLEDAIYYDGYWGAVMDCIWKQKEFKTTKWSKGDTIKFVLDCTEWKITFYKNGEEVGQWKIREKKRYYLVIQLNSMKGYDFKIVEYQ
eukprot:5484_1